MCAEAQGELPRTDPRLLKRVAELWDNLAWCEFFRHYDPLVSGWCRAYGLDAASTDELRQRVWVELARRMPSYQYDPARSFRGWLRCLYRERSRGYVPVLPAPAPGESKADSGPLWTFSS